MAGEQVVSEPSQRGIEVSPTSQATKTTGTENTGAHSDLLDNLKHMSDEAHLTGRIGNHFEELGKEYLEEMINNERPADSTWTSKGQEPKGVLIVDDDKEILREVTHDIQEKRKAEQKRRDREEKEAKKNSKDSKKVSKGEEKTVSQDIRMKVPDTLVIGIEPASGVVVIRACDFKMNMDYAQQAQVHPKAVIELLNASARARTSLEAQIKSAVGKDVTIPDVVSLEQSGQRMTLGREDLILDSGFFLTVDSEDNTNHFARMDTVQKERGNLRGRVTRDRALVMSLDDAEVNSFFDSMRTSDTELRTLIDTLPMGIEGTEQTTHFDQTLREFRITEVASTLVSTMLNEDSQSKESGTQKIFAKAVAAGCKTQMDVLSYLQDQAKLAEVRQRLVQVIENKATKET